MQTPNSTTHKPSTRKIDEIQEFLDLYYISWFRINQTYNLWAQCHGIQDSTMFLLDEIHRNPEHACQQGAAAQADRLLCFEKDGGGRAHRSGKQPKG